MSLPIDPFYVPDDIFCAGRRKDVLPMPAPHAHSQVELNFVLTGGFTYLVGGRQVAAEAGDFLFFWGALPHQALTVRPGSTFICIYVPLAMFLAMRLSAALSSAVLAGAVIAAERPHPFDAATPLRLHADLMVPDARLVELDRAEIELILRRVDLAGWRDRAGLADGRRSAPALAAHEKAAAMARFMAARAGEPLGVEDVARAVGLHPNYAMTLFRQVVGMTIGAYLTRQRLYAAQQRLLATRQDVASIAFESGFGSVSRFYAAFRREFGVAPHRFRLAAQTRAAGAAAPDPALVGPAV